MYTAFCNIKNDTYTVLAHPGIYYKSWQIYLKNWETEA